MGNLLSQLYIIFGELPIVSFDQREREFAFEDFAVQVQFNTVVILIRYFIRAGVGYTDTASAFIYGALVGEESQWVVEAFYGIGGGSDKLLRGFVEAPGLKGIGDLEHKIPMNI